MYPVNFNISPHKFTIYFIICHFCSAENNTYKVSKKYTFSSGPRQEGLIFWDTVSVYKKSTGFQHPVLLKIQIGFRITKTKNVDDLIC